MGCSGAVCAAGTEGASRKPARTLKLCHPLNRANGIFWSDPPLALTGLPTRSSDGSPDRRLPTDPHGLPLGQPGTLKTSLAWDKDEFPRGAGIPSADRVLKRVHGLPGRSPGRRFRRPRLEPIGGSWARAMGRDHLMGTECPFGVDCPGVWAETCPRGRGATFIQR